MPRKIVWKSGVWSCILPGLTAYLVQELNVGTVCMPECMFESVCIYVCVLFFVCAFIYVSMYVCMDACMHVCRYVCIVTE